MWYVGGGETLTAASTAYHLQTDGHMEQANQEVKVLLWVLIREDQSDWAAMLPLAQFAMNNRSIWNSDITPFQALHGYEPAPIPELTLGEQVLRLKNSSPILGK